MIAPDSQSGWLVKKKNIRMSVTGAPLIRKRTLRFQMRVADRPANAPAV
jgi:hypothetical protein